MTDPISLLTKCPRVLGLDLSLTATGVAFPDGTTTVWNQPLTGVARLAWFRQALTDYLEGSATYRHAVNVDMAVIEEYAFSARGAHSHELGELGGVVRLALHDLEVPWVAVNPSTLKSYACGRGNATKPDMRIAHLVRFGTDLRDDNQVDARWLRHAALDHYGHPEVDMPQKQRAALAKVAWPDLAA